MAQAQNMSPKLEKVFLLIDEAGGPKLPQIKKLNSKDRQTIVFNIWGGIFGLFYYLYHRMWRKALVLLLISIVVSVVIEMILSLFVDQNTLNTFVSFISLGVSVAIFGTRANIDLYKKHKLNIDGWI